MKKFLHDRPWIWIVVGILVMIASLAVVVAISLKYEPESIPLEHETDGP